MEHFHFWGAEKQVRAARTIPREYGIGGLTAYGTLLGPYSYDWMQRELVRPFYFTDNERLPQYATEAVLRRRVAELACVEALYGWSASEVSQDDGGAGVRITERAGSGQRRLRADYLVGCDGSRSTVREQAGIAQTLSDHDRLMVLLVFRSQGLHGLLEQRHPGKSFLSVLHPELQGYWKFFGRVDLGSTWFFHAPVPAGTTRDNFDFRRQIYEAAGAEFDVEFQHIGFWDLRFAVADSYGIGPDLHRRRRGPQSSALRRLRREPGARGREKPRLEAGREAAWLGGPGLLASYGQNGAPCFNRRRAISSSGPSWRIANSWQPSIPRATGTRSSRRGRCAARELHPRCTPSSPTMKARR